MLEPFLEAISFLLGSRLFARPVGIGSWALGFLFFELFGQVRQADGFVACSFGYYAVIEGYSGGSCGQFADLEARRGFVRDVEAFAVSGGCDEYVVSGCEVDGLGKFGIERDRGCAVAQRPRTEIFEPVFRRLHGVERNFVRAAIHGGSSNNVAGAIQVAAGIHAT